MLTGVSAFHLGEDEDQVERPTVAVAVVARPVGRAKHGREARGGCGSEASSSRSNIHTGVAVYEFFVDLDYRPHSRLPLPDSFAMALVDSKPSNFWLQVDGCPNGPPWDSAEYAMDDSMRLGQGWKSFARFRR